MVLINQPLDLYGQNVYFSSPVQASAGGDFTPPSKLTPGYTKNSLSWPVSPECLYWAPLFLYERYKTPIIISENGMAALDAVSLDGKVHDSTRIDFIQKHLLSLLEAIIDGVDIRGYFHWSIFDNFEWSMGYSDRFGLVYIDFETLRRRVKDSAYYYSDVIKNNGRNLGDKWAIYSG
jgi:beta-glucosidase